MINQILKTLKKIKIKKKIFLVIKPTKVLKAFIDKNPRKIELNIFNRVRVHLSSFFNKKIVSKRHNKVDRLSLFWKIRSYIFIQLCKLYF